MPTPQEVFAGSPEEMLAKAGIKQSDWYYAKCVIAGCDGVSAEGGFDGVQKWNYSGSGAYGLCQALPASKMARAGADYMTNPITQLKWCNLYAHERYGSWQAAWTFRKCRLICWQPVYGKWIDKKNHTYW